MTAVPIIDHGTVGGSWVTPTSWANLLPELRGKGGGGGSQNKNPGHVCGRGVPSDPIKVSRRIQAWEFVDMVELLSEFWTQKNGRGQAQPVSANRRKHPVTEVNAWLQCFSVYVGVMSIKHPEAVLEHGICGGYNPSLRGLYGNGTGKV